MPSRRYLRTARMEAFSDGVFAIAITLLVLELAVGTEGSALHRLLNAWPSYLAYLVSFAMIGAAWLIHNSITDRLTKATLGLLRINLVILLVVGFLPFPTKLVAEGLHSGVDKRVYVTLYGLTLLALRVLLYVFDEYARRANLFDERGPVGALIRPRFGVVLAAYGVILALGLFHPVLAIVLFLVVALSLILPTRGVRHLLVRPDH